MAIEIKRRRGTTVDHSTFTGAVGETTIDLDKDTVVVHDGATAGGFPLLREDLSNAPSSVVTPFAKTILDDASAAAALTTLGASSFTQTSLLPLADLDALKTLLGFASVELSPGLVNYFAGVAPPSGWLVCDGTAVSRATYANLFAQISTIYGAGDGSTTFNLPDLRGEFIRCNDEGRGVDSGRNVGSYQAYATGPHTHTINGYVSSALFLYRAGGGNPGVGIPYSGASASAIQNNAGSETRPRNVSLLACIKY